MARIIGKNKPSFTPVLMPLLYSEPTETAKVPLWQSDGSVKYVDVEVLKQMIDDGFVELINQPS